MCWAIRALRTECWTVREVAFAPELTENTVTHHDNGQCRRHTYRREPHLARITASCQVLSTRYSIQHHQKTFMEFHPDKMTDLVTTFKTHFRS